MTHSISIRHNFEAAHRLPHLPGKCQSIHGHSFWAEVTIGTADPLPHDGVLIEYGEAKAFLREWVDTFWDHGTILGAQDPLVTDHGGRGGAAKLLGKVYVMDDTPAGNWPTVETLAWRLGTVLRRWLRGQSNHQVRLVVEQVTIRETHVNAATWINPEVS